MSIASNHRIRLFAAFFIAEVIFTGFFLLIPKTPVVITSYCFGLLAPVALLLAMLEMTTANKRNYIIKAVFYPAAITYMLCNYLAGVIFSALDLSGAWSIHAGWLLLIHAIMLALLAWRYLTLDAGSEQIEELGERVAAKVINWQMIRADVENLKSYAPGHCHNDLQAVIDAIRYADPMSHESMAAYDEAIKDSVLMLEVKLNGQQYDEVAMLCLKIQKQIKDRNTRMELLK